MTTRIDIGEGRWVEPVVHHETDGVIVGYIETHPHVTTGAECRGWLATDPETDGPSRWDVVQADPLTLSPSIQCRACGNHGFIRDGKWVTA